METEQLVELLRREWSLEDGFFAGIRFHQFREDRLDRLIAILKSIETENIPQLDRDLVTQLWFMPMVVEWQIRSFEEAALDAGPVNVALDRILNELYRILGVP